MEAWQTWQALAIHSREYGGMGGECLPLRLADVRAECAHACDSDGITRRVLVIERIFMEFEAARRKREAARSKK